MVHLAREREAETVNLPLACGCFPIQVALGIGVVAYVYHIIGWYCVIALYHWVTVES